MVQYAQITHTNITNFTRLSNILPHHVALHHAAGTRTRAMTVAHDPRMAGPGQSILAHGTVMIAWS